jgi:uncharacterized protein (TIGR02284 family)
MEERSKAVDKLNQLLEKNYDAEKEYRKAAENTHNSLLKSILDSEAEKRRDFGIKLKDEIAKLGGMPEKEESTASKIHRTWIDVKTALAGNSDQSIVEECRRGDEAAIEEYESVLKDSELTASSRKMVQQQREEITDMYHQWTNLKI